MYACVIPGLVYFNIMITVSEVMGNVIYTCRQIKKHYRTAVHAAGFRPFWHFKIKKSVYGSEFTEGIYS